MLDIRSKITYICTVKQKIYFYFIFTLFYGSLLAQKPFVCSPSTYLNISLPPNTLTAAQINMINQTSGSLTLKWLKYTNTIPSTWSASLCDYNTCYTGIPNVGTMTPINGLTQGFIKIEVNPFTYTGTAKVVVYVYSGSTPTLGDTLVFDFIASGTTEIQNQPQFEKEKVNLLANAIHIQNYASDNDILVVDMSGKIVLQKSILPHANEIFYTNNLPSGLYFIRTRYQSYKYLKP